MFSIQASMAEKYLWRLARARGAFMLAEWWETVVLIQRRVPHAGKPLPDPSAARGCDGVATGRKRPPVANPSTRPAGKQSGGFTLNPAAGNAEFRVPGPALSSLCCPTGDRAALMPLMGPRG